MWLYHLTRASRPLFGLVWRMELTGEIDSIPRTGPAIVVANHSSFVDPWILGPFLFPRPVHFLITRLWYDKSPLWNFVFRSYRTIPMETHAGGTLEASLVALAEGRIVGIFPEGRISYDGRVKRFRTGVCYLAAKSGAPVIPVGIRGAFESLPRSRHLPSRGRVRLEVGRPLRFPESPRDDPPPRSSVREFRDLLFAEVCRLAGQQGTVSRRLGLESGSAASPPEGELPDTLSPAPLDLES